MKPHEIFENAKITKRLKQAVLVVVILLIALDFGIEFLFHHRHSEFPWDDVPGFSALFGLISCVLIIVVSKVLGKIWLQKKEDYYD